MDHSERVSLWQLKADWARVKCDFYALKMLFAGRRWIAALEREAAEREQRFNPYHDEAGRFTTADGAVAPGSGRRLGDAGARDAGTSDNTAGDNRARVAQAGPPRPGGIPMRNIAIPLAPGRVIMVTPETLAELTELGAQVRVARDEAMRLRPDYRAETYLTSDTEEGLRSEYRAQLREYNEVIREAGRQGSNNAPLPEPNAGRSGIGTSTDASPNFDFTQPPPPFIYYDQVYRNLTGMPPLTQGRAVTLDQGTVARAEIDGKATYGVNSEALSFTHHDRAVAFEMRDLLLDKYPDVMDTGNIGRMPNNAVFHAEATVLLRAARVHGGTLSGRSIEIDVDRTLCGSCKAVLPLIAREVGNPTVKIRDATGKSYLIKNGNLKEE